MSETGGASPGGGKPIPLGYEPRRERVWGPSTLGPPGPVARGLWWVAYRVGRVVGHVWVKPREGRRGR